MAKRNQHVVPHPEGWAVKPEHGQRASSVHDTQREAIEGTGDRPQPGKRALHPRPDGRIRERDSYGNDPFPPEG